MFLLLILQYIVHIYILQTLTRREMQLFISFLKSIMFSATYAEGPAWILLKCLRSGGESERNLDIRGGNEDSVPFST